MLHTPHLDAFSIACLLVMLVLSIIMFRLQTSAPRHAFSLAALCAIAIAIWILRETVLQRAQPPVAVADTLAASNRPLPVVSGLMVPVLLLVLFATWHLLTRRWQTHAPRLRAYAIHWALVLGWIAASLLEPTNIFSVLETQPNLTPAEHMAVVEQNIAASRRFEHAVLAYAAMVLAAFVLPLLPGFWRRT